MVYTLFTFSVSTLSAAEQLGIVIDDADKADYYALIAGSKTVEEILAVWPGAKPVADRIGAGSKK